MTSETLKNLTEAKSREEFIMTCDLMGDIFDNGEFELFSSMENWQKTLYTYGKSCKERKIRDILTT